MSDASRLLEIMRRLRDPEKGCPWDVGQTFETVAPYTIEEAYEVSDAIASGDRVALREELGDLLFQVVFHARMAEEEGAFGFSDVVDAVCEKLERRHPHVFAEPGSPPPSWEAVKADERAAKARAGGREASAIDDVPRALPALSRAAKLQRRMASAGFAWGSTEALFAKVEEEVAELREELERGDAAAAGRELGDVLFVVANLATTIGSDPETDLRGTNARVEGRFRRLEAGLRAEGRAMKDLAPDELLARWTQAKRAAREEGEEP